MSNTPVEPSVPNEGDEQTEQDRRDAEREAQRNQPKK